MKPRIINIKYIAYDINPPLRADVIPLGGQVCIVPGEDIWLGLIVIYLCDLRIQL